MTRPVSPSEASDFGTCERLHYFKYRLGLRPVSKGAKDWGTLFHTAIQPFYEAMRDGGDKQDCFKAGEAALNKAQEEDESLLAYAFQAYGRFQWYSNHYYDEDASSWEILSIEQRFTLPEHDFAFTPDMIVREKKGQHRDDLLLIDFKTGQKFWTPRQFEVNSQLPKYLWGLRQIPEFKSIRRYMISQIKTYDLKNPTPRDIFKRDRITPPPIKVRNMRKYHEISARRILKFEKLSEKEHREEALPAYSFATCNYCTFSTLCDIVTTEGNFEIAAKIGFKEEPYVRDNVIKP